MVTHECIDCRNEKSADSFKDKCGRMPKIMRCRECLDTHRKNRKMYHDGEHVDVSRQCVSCLETYPIGDFTRRKASNGQFYPHAKCKPCLSSHRKKTRKRNITAEKSRSDTEKWERVHQPARHILKASRASDKKRNQENDMDVKYITDLIVNGCGYCGDNSSRMTIDRINNALGHIKGNVVPSCYQCNMIRRDMPYEAWLHILDRILEAKQMGLLGSWLKTPFARV